MLKHLGIKGVGAIAALLMWGCLSPAYSLDNYEGYQEIDPSQFAQRFSLSGYDPRTVAMDMFKTVTVEREGRRSEGFTIDYHRGDGAFRATVNITVVGLADDSIAAQRFQVELVWDAELDWQITWVGEQWRCWEERGSQDWTTELCS
ncbi:MAG: hypothetical protein F6J87_08535 [Spirulina sp. SIO3F2]|nr:hypothetical protein [Spirulina sp. SIO3F2]